MAACAATPEVRRKNVQTECGGRAGNCEQALRAAAPDCEAGDLDSCRVICTKGFEQRKACETACNAKDAPACGKLGLVLLEGMRPEPKRAVELLPGACQGGVGEACTAMVRAARKHRHLQLSDEEVAGYLLSACEHGNSVGCFAMGMNHAAFDEGEGEGEAVDLLHRAAQARTRDPAFWGARSMLTCLTGRDSGEGALAGNARRQEDCIGAEGVLVEKFSWAKLYPGSLLARFPWVSGAAAQGGVDIDILPRGSEVYCYSITPIQEGKTQKGRWVTHTGVETLANCKTEEKACQAEFTLTRSGAGYLRSPCQKSAAKALHCFTFKQAGRRSYLCSENGSVCSEMLRQHQRKGVAGASVCVPWAL